MSSLRDGFPSASWAYRDARRARPACRLTATVTRCIGHAGVPVGVSGWERKLDDQGLIRSQVPQAELSHSLSWAGARMFMACVDVIASHQAPHKLIQAKLEQFVSDSCAILVLHR